MKTAAVLARAKGSKLIVLYVTNSGVYSYGRMSPVYIDQMKKDVREEAKAVVKRARDLVRDENLDIHVEVIEGMLSPVQAITEYAEKERIDLIVVGTRGMSGFKKLLLGSVSSGVISHSHCSVLLVR